METPKKPLDQNAATFLGLADVSVSDLSLQLYRDYTSDQDPEKLFLVISEILARGPEGRAALLQMSQGTDSLSATVQKVLSAGEVDSSELEQILGVKRFGPIINLDDDGRTKKIYEYLKEKGVVSVDLNRFLDEERLRALQAEMSNRPSHLTGEIEKERIVSSLTFGVTEPSYLELLGPKELLRLRHTENQDMLLLGSYGPYSAREFRAFAERITKNPITHVLDIDPLCISMMQKDENVNNRIIQGDARKMPFPENSLDQIYTNHLFHFLGIDDFKQNQDADVLKVLKEAARVLRPGGFLILDEEAFGEHKDNLDVHNLLYEISLYANKFGLRSVRGSTSNWGHVLRAEIGNATIDDLGFPHYENCMLVLGRADYVRALFVKE